MIHYSEEFQEMTVRCDNLACPDSLNVSGSWRDCIDEIKREGWKIQKTGAQWEHFCRDHSEVAVDDDDGGTIDAD